MTENKVVLITGSSSGIGRNSAITLARHGHTVFATMRAVTGKNKEAAEALRALAEEEQLALHVVELDVTDATSVTAAVESVLAQAGQIDVLVNNAGVGLVGISEAATIEQLQAVFDVNLFGMMRVLQAVLPGMRARGEGLLLYISSTGSRLCYPFLGFYNATKAAMESVAESVHYEVFTLGIDTSIAQFGGYATQWGSNVVLSQDTALWSEYGTVGEIATGWLGALPQMLSAEYVSDPQEAADDILRLVEMPKGTRPFRFVSGTGSEGMELINETIASVQARVLPMYGLAALENRPSTS